MSVVIIGNGASALNNKHSNFVDSSDYAIRLGAFIIEGYEDYIGTKTDIYVSRWFKSKVRSKEFFDNLKEVWIPRTYCTREEKYDNLVANYKLSSKIKYIPEHLVFTYKARYPFRYILENTARRGNKELFCCIPDSGIVAIDMAKHFYPTHQIFLIGFDNCKTGYYWEPDKVLDNPGKDLLELQEHYLKGLIKTNQVVDLSNSL